MENKKFNIEQREGKVEEDGKKEYQRRILSVVNDQEKAINAPKVKPNSPFHNYLHRESRKDSRNEVSQYEPLRKEICETFGVPMDQEHVWIREVEKSDFDGKETQRDFRVFCVLLKPELNEGFYGEGRTHHKDIFNHLLDLAREYKEKHEIDLGLEDIDDFSDFEDLLEVGEKNVTENGWMWSKGFMNKDGFSDIPDRFRSSNEKFIIDNNGEKIATPEDWFISGGSITS